MALSRGYRPEDRIGFRRENIRADRLAGPRVGFNRWKGWVEGEGASRVGTLQGFGSLLKGQPFFKRFYQGR